MAQAIADDVYGGGKARGHGLPVNRADPSASLRGLRIGCVKYLNSRPLICAYDGPVTFDHPSALARMLAAGELDAALVPAFEALRDPQYQLVDGVAVGCDGPVFSVFLAYRGELRDVRSVAADPASLSSLNLLKVLLAEFHGMQPVFGENGDARLLIGNQAIDFRMSKEAEEGRWKFLDLGEEWKRCTGLPFVFAVWALLPALPRASEIADALRAIQRAGVACIPELIATEEFTDEETRRRYLTEFLCFDLGPREKAGLERYRELLAKHGLHRKGVPPLSFV